MRASGRVARSLVVCVLIESGPIIMYVCDYPPHELFSERIHLCIRFRFRVASECGTEIVHNSCCVCVLEERGVYSMCNEWGLPNDSPSRHSLRTGLELDASAEL